MSKQSHPNLAAASPLLAVAAIVVFGSLALFLILNLLRPSSSTSEKSHEGVASNSAITQGDKERADYPLLAHLPIQNAVYTIGYQFDESGVPTIIIDTTEYYLEYALEKLQSLGTPERPATSYQLEIKNWTGSEKEQSVLKKFQDQTL